MARRKISDLAKPEPLEFEDESGAVLFVMPRRLWHLSPAERAEYERLAEAQMVAAVEFREFLTSAQGAAARTDEGKATEAEFKARMRTAQFALLERILPGLSRELFETLSEAQAAELFEEFTTSPFVQRTGDPETSVSAAT